MKGFTKGKGKGKKFIPTSNKKQGLKVSDIKKHQHEDDRIGKTLPLTRRKGNLDKGDNLYDKYLEMFGKDQDWRLGGGFGQALKNNDLPDAVSRADKENLERLSKLTGLSKEKLEQMVQDEYHGSRNKTSLDDSEIQELEAKEKKLSNYLEHARTQEIPISKKETELFNIRKRLGMNPTWGE